MHITVVNTLKIINSIRKRPLGKRMVNHLVKKFPSFYWTGT